LFQREEEIRGGVRFAGGGCLVRCHQGLAGVATRARSVIAESGRWTTPDRAARAHR
jgi:hypothetical protein